MSGEPQPPFYLAYDAPVDVITGSGHRRVGRQFSSRPDDLAFVTRVAATMNDLYGEGTHWVEDEAGEKILTEGVDT